MFKVRILSFFIRLVFDDTVIRTGFLDRIFWNFFERSPIFSGVFIFLLRIMKIK